MCSHEQLVVGMRNPHGLSRKIARGRGAAEAPPNRFEKLQIEWEPEIQAGQAPDDDLKNPPRAIKTTFLRDDTQSIISKNDSPDIPFDISLNPYRGCEHGCAYCYARPYHEYLGFDAGIDFESKIMVKPEAANLLELALSRKHWEPKTLACSGVTDCYQPVEKRLEITRQCLKVLSKCLHPIGMISKNHLVTRDIDLLEPMARVGAASVTLSITTLDPKLAHRLEPRASSPQQRLDAVRRLGKAGIPASINVAPIIPGLNDHEIPAILEAAADHGAIRASYTLVRLPHAVKDIFAHWLEDFLPGHKEKILGRIREFRETGSLNETEFGNRMRGSGRAAEDLRTLFMVSRKRHGLDRVIPPLETTHFTPPQGRQLELAW